MVQVGGNVDDIDLLQVALIKLREVGHPRFVTRLIQRVDRLVDRLDDCFGGIPRSRGEQQERRNNGSCAHRYFTLPWSSTRIASAMSGEAASLLVTSTR